MTLRYLKGVARAHAVEETGLPPGPARWALRCYHRRRNRAGGWERGLARHLLEASPNLVALATLEGQLRYLNTTGLSSLGGTPAQPGQTTFFDLVHPQDRLHVLDVFDRLSALPGTSEVVRFRSMHRNAHPHVLEAVLTNRIEDPTMNGILITAQDITDAIRAHRLLLRKKDRQEALAELSLQAHSAGSLQELFHVCLASLTEQLEAPYAYLLEYDVKDNRFLFHTGIGWAPPPEASFPTRMDAEAGLALRSTQPVLVFDFHEDPRFSGATVPVDVPARSALATPIPGEDRPFGVLGIYHPEPDAFAEADKPFLRSVANILSLALSNRQHAIELSRAREEADRMNRLKSAFLDNLSHEIRTPLASIIGFAALMQENVPEEHRSYIRFIERSGQRLLHTINAVLDFSMLEAGSLRPSLQQTDVGVTIENAAHQMRPLAEEKGLVLNLLLPDQPLLAYLDPNFLHRILIQLIENAVKFSEQGTVVVLAEQREGRIEIRISDSGIGISRRFLKHLFEAFSQESTGVSRLYEGLGLGLTLAKNLVDMMGGVLSVTSKKGQGSTFTLSFPASTLPDRPPSPPLPDRHPEEVFSVLVVDDNEDILFLLRRYLANISGCRIIETAANEEAALTLAHQHPFDLVLMDINLGRERNGIDVLEMLRRLPGYAGVPVVAVTAYAMAGDRERFLDAGFDGYLAKPFTFEQFRTMVADMLQVSP